MEMVEVVNKYLLPIVLSSFLIQGCSDDEVNVKWGNYSPIVKQRIDEMVGTKDCEGLQKEFDAADRNNDSQRRRTGESNMDLMEFLNVKMGKIGCHA